MSALDHLHHPRLLLALAALSALAIPVPLVAAEILPPASQLRPDRPRLLLRPSKTPHAISLEELRGPPRDREFEALLGQLRGNRHAAAQAMVWLLTGEEKAAEAAIRRMREYRFPGAVDTFHVYGRLTEMALAYDWLAGCEGLSDEIRAEIRARVRPLAEHGLKVASDHMFHNYIWMSAGGVALWALATAGDDADSGQLYEKIRSRFNAGLFPAWRYLDGLPSEPMGYWALYVFTPGALAILAAQSASETDIVDRIRREEGDWLARHFENLIHSTLPDWRYLPWGDLQSGPNGGVTHEMAGIVDALTWALDSRRGAHFSRWLAGSPRGLGRFYGETAVFYMLYARRLKTEPETPPLSFLAGGPESGHFIARSGWDEGSTIVSLTATDHFGDHHHYDQGSFIIYRRGLLAVDPPIYRQTRGPQQRTEYHNTLLLDGQPQRPARGQWFLTVEDFQKNLRSGRRLEMGDMIFYREAGDWAACAAQFAQAYPDGLVESCVRQMLFIRPNRILIADHLAAAEGGKLPEIEWLLHLPATPAMEDDPRGVSSSNGRSWIRCRPLGKPASEPEVEPTEMRTHRVTFRYEGERAISLIHFLEVGDGTAPAPSMPASVEVGDGFVRVSCAGRAFSFASREPFEVRAE